MSNPVLLNSKSANDLYIRVAGGISLTPEVETILRVMFSSFGKITIEAEFGRGFSGSHTFRVRLFERDGKAHLPAAIKIAPLGLIHEEWQAYQNWVKDSLPKAARLESPPTFLAENQWAGLRYTLVGDGTFTIQSLHDYYRETNLDDVCWVLEKRLFELMGQNWWLDSRVDRAFQMQSDYDILLPVNLSIKYGDIPLPGDTRVLEAGNLSTSSVGVGDQVQLKGFVITKVDQKRRQLTLNLPSAAGQAPISYRVRFEAVPDNDVYQVGQVINSIHGTVIATRHDFLVNQVQQMFGNRMNPLVERLPLIDNQNTAFPFKMKIRTSPRLHTSSYPPSLPNPLLTYQDLLQDFLTVNVSIVHGDLNLENILVDPATRDITLIDFATVRRGHVLHDLLRLETEILITLLPPALAEADLPPEIIFPFYEQLHQAIPNPEQAVAPNLLYASLEKPFGMLRVIRKMARKCLFNLDDWREYYRGLILYLLGALKFESLDTRPTAPLPKQVAFWGAAIAQHLLELPLPSQISSPNPVITLSHSQETNSTFELETPFGTMRPNSKLYIERAADKFCWEQINSSYATTLFVQAPMQTGKSSLMRKSLYLARQIHQIQFAFIDFQKFTEQYFEDEENFFIQFCVMIGDALGIPEAIDQYWTGRRSNIVKCSLYLSRYIIPQLRGAFILAMDEVERMQTSRFRSGFFGMLRTWHNERAFDESFARMTLFLSSSTDPFLLIDNPHQSPFNVATPISLQDFTTDEVSELNRCHNSPLNEIQVNELMSLVNGHPFLTRLSLYQLTLGKIDLHTLITHATEDAGLFGDHLRHYLLRIWQKPELKQALTLISQKHTCPENEVFYRLKESGLIKKIDQQVVFRNSLYERYFKERLNG